MREFLSCPAPDVRFWAKVQRRPSGCWEWAGYVDQLGYGRVCRVVDGFQRVYSAHRIAYEGAHGPISAGLVLDHLCRNRRCVNPDHLEPVTQATNIARGEWFVGENAAKTHCPEGHPYSEENTYVIPATGGRMCRTCKAAGRQAERQRRRARPLVQQLVESS